MSDASTDINRDGRISQLLYEIELKEDGFIENPSIEKAKEISKLWIEYKYMPSGYWSGSDEELANRKLGYYKEYLETKEIPDFSFPRTGDGIYLYRAIGGHGLWMYASLNSIFSEMMKRKINRDDVVKIKIKDNGDLDVFEVTCANCPYIYKPFGCSLVSGDFKRINCKGFNADEYIKVMQKKEELENKGVILEKELKNK